MYEIINHGSRRSIIRKTLNTYINRIASGAIVCRWRCSIAVRKSTGARSLWLRAARVSVISKHCSHPWALHGVGHKLIALVPTNLKAHTIPMVCRLIPDKAVGAYTALITLRITIKPSLPIGVIITARVAHQSRRDV